MTQNGTQSRAAIPAGLQIGQVVGRAVGSMGAITTPLWGSFDPADLETTVTTLREITLRARSLTSAPAPSGAEGGRS